MSCLHKDMQLRGQARSTSEPFSSLALQLPFLLQASPASVQGQHSNVLPTAAAQLLPGNGMAASSSVTLSLLGCRLLFC